MLVKVDTMSINMSIKYTETMTILIFLIKIINTLSK